MDKQNKIKLSCDCRFALICVFFLLPYLKGSAVGNHGPKASSRGDESNLGNFGADPRSWGVVGADPRP